MKNCSELVDKRYQEQTKKNWTAAPCGSNYSQEEFLSKEFFDEVEHHRYTSHPWILKNIKNLDVKDKQVLEIGFGMGTDHLALAREGGMMHGIDLTPKNRTVTQTRFDIYGYQSELITGEAEKLPYDDNSFDIVYSFGVIHHSPQTDRIIDEIYRVLKPGGKCWISVYHKNSIFFWWTVFLVDWIIKQGYKKETLKERISKVEYPNDNPDLVVTLYTVKEFAKMFKSFSQVSTKIDHLTQEDIRRIGHYFPQKILDYLAKKWGWYIIVEAKK